MGRKIIFGKKSTGKGIFHQDEEGHLLALRSKLPWWDVPCLVLFSTPIMKRDQQHERTEIANTTGEKKWGRPNKREEKQNAKGSLEDTWEARVSLRKNQKMFLWLQEHVNKLFSWTQELNKGFKKKHEVDTKRKKRGSKWRTSKKPHSIIYFRYLLLNVHYYIFMYITLGPQSCLYI